VSIQSRVFPPSARPQLRSSLAYLSISLSNRLTASPTRLRQALQWMHRNVGQFDILVGDYFHRHNLEDLERRRPDEALALATADGRVHGHRLRSALNQLGLLDIGIRHASDFTHQTTFASALHSMKLDFGSNQPFARLVEQGADAFLGRLAPGRISIEIARRHSREYQLEELALFTVLANEGYNTNVYAGAHLPIMKALVMGDVNSVAKEFTTMQLVELRFRGGT